jgi:hypothetical protein
MTNTEKKHLIFFLDIMLAFIESFFYFEKENDTFDKEFFFKLEKLIHKIIINKHNFFDDKEHQEFIHTMQYNDIVSQKRENFIDTIFEIKQELQNIKIALSENKDFDATNLKNIFDKFSEFNKRFSENNKAKNIEFF